MPPVAIVLVLVAAALHAGWNVLLKTSGDTLGTAVRLQALGTAILLPLAVVGWFLTGEPGIDPGGVGVAFVSGILEALYFIFLSAAYSRGDLSLVYPLATVAPLRESGIVLAAAWGAMRLGETSGGREAGTRIIAAAFVVLGAVLLAVSA